ncbi:hypothetical protein [Nakamurella endophytica]|uniref:Uncharacterized protein n=1 Tax=Nakamurella endophytica TaxID=1748367 RepID=A0A917SXF7_9ACTN|nr:hypothetical protein [Nakamurella endophytica]GGM02545.1 hypothetical protein GCM10011594_23320 [Nakamurella endophytica]
MSDQTQGSEPTQEELEKAAGAESYEGEPVTEEELGKVWEAPEAQQAPSDGQG